MSNIMFARWVRTINDGNGASLGQTRLGTGCPRCRNQSVAGLAHRRTARHDGCALANGLKWSLVECLSLTIQHVAAALRRTPWSLAQVHVELRIGPTEIRSVEYASTPGQLCFFRFFPCIQTVQSLSLSRSSPLRCTNP